ncbi:MAG: hypothetical protein OER88_13665, partial [Planctomycetota bacterium]|nr:hypothetical protein [Planctomycetota bacterium]
MRRATFLLVLALALSARAQDPGPDLDPLQDALAAMRIAPGDLGYRPKATWPRYPHPDRTPYVLP